MSKEQSQGQTEKLNPVGSSGWFGELVAELIPYAPGLVMIIIILTALIVLKLG